MSVSLVSSRPPTVYVRLQGQTVSVETLGVVDTGATSMLVTPDVATHLGYDLSRAPVFRAVTVNGVVELPKITLAEVRVGECVATDVEAVCHELAEGGFSVLIGLSFLQHFRVCLDFRKKRLSLSRE
jgi:clan AA aspartic protease (TIGR02281 family)